MVLWTAQNEGQRTNIYLKKRETRSSLIKGSSPEGCTAPLWVWSQT